MLLYQRQYLVKLLRRISALYILPSSVKRTDDKMHGSGMMY